MRMRFTAWQPAHSSATSPSTPCSPTSSRDLSYRVLQSGTAHLLTLQYLTLDAGQFAADKVNVPGEGDSDAKEGGELHQGYVLQLPAKLEIIAKE